MAVMLWQWNRDEKNETANPHGARSNRTRMSIFVTVRVDRLEKCH